MGLFTKEKLDKTENIGNSAKANAKEAETLTQTPQPQNKGPVMSSAALLHNEARQISSPAEIGVPLSVSEEKFSDLYITPNKICYVRSGKSENGLKVAKFTDLAEFVDAVIGKYEGNNSYSLKYKGRNYRIEKTIALEGEQYCVRKMPASVPNIEKLGIPEGVYRHLMGLSNKSGLILLAGATGSGKSTTISALIKKYLQKEGGYAFTIEDPIEMPLDGVYQTENGDLGLCKQTVPPEGNWSLGIKSALRSKPRYMYLGEIRSADVAAELLRAATSGHLVFSTIHGNNVVDAINSLAKYAASSGFSEEMAYEMIANGFLGCLYQRLEGNPQKLIMESLFANPDINSGCQVRAMLRTGRLNLSTILEQQKAKLIRGVPLFDNIL